jgi:uncharacterized protein (UPF0147 family)
MTECKEIIFALRQLGDDTDVPKSVKQRIETCIRCLETSETPHIRLSKALHNLEDLGDNSNLQPMTRTQLLGVMSLIESKAHSLR